MYGACHINGTWGNKEVGRLELLYEGGIKVELGKNVFKLQIIRNFVITSKYWLKIINCTLEKKPWILVKHLNSRNRFED